MKNIISICGVFIWALNRKVGSSSPNVGMMFSHHHFPSKILVCVVDGRGPEHASICFCRVYCNQELILIELTLFPRGLGTRLILAMIEPHQLSGRK